MWSEHEWSEHTWCTWIGSINSFNPVNINSFVLNASNLCIYHPSTIQLLRGPCKCIYIHVYSRANYVSFFQKRFCSIYSSYPVYVLNMIPSNYTISGKAISGKESSPIQQHTCDRWWILLDYSLYPWITGNVRHISFQWNSYQICLTLHIFHGSNMPLGIWYMAMVIPSEPLIMG